MSQLKDGLIHLLVFPIAIGNESSLVQSQPCWTNLLKFKTSLVLFSLSVISWVREKEWKLCEAARKFFTIFRNHLLSIRNSKTLIGDSVSYCSSGFCRFVGCMCLFNFPADNCLFWEDLWKFIKVPVFIFFPQGPEKSYENQFIGWHRFQIHIWSRRSRCCKGRTKLYTK